MMREWEWLGLAVDAAIAALFWKLYKDKSRDADIVENARSFPLDRQLKEGEIINYARVEGYVKPLSDTIRSMFTADEGVIHNIAYIEHKAKKEGGFWRDTTHTIRDNFRHTPFTLETGNPSSSIRVEEPLSADFLLDSLTVTHDQFEPTQSNLLSKGLDRIFGDVSKGFQEKERILPVGASLLGFGKVMMEKGANILMPPDSGKPYILTTQTKRQVLQDLQGSAKVYRVLCYVFGVAGVGIVGYIVYKQYRKWLQKREVRALQQEVRVARERSARGDGDAADNDMQRECVICLSNPREVIVLDCGHICMCLDCSQSLPEPRKCPVCRADVDRIRSVFLA